MPAMAPVCRPGGHYDSLHTTGRRSTFYGMDAPSLSGLITETSIQMEHQADPQIGAISDQFMTFFEQRFADREDREPTGEILEWLQELGVRESAVIGSLHALRYHQRQFFSRLRTVTGQQAEAFHTPDDRHRLQIVDGPLQYELEAFLLRTSAILDALAKVLCFLLGRSDRNWGGLLKTLSTDSSIHADARIQLAEQWSQHHEPLERNIKLRHAILHDGRLEGFEGITHKGVTLIDASVRGVPAGTLAVQTWVSLRELVPASIGAVYRLANAPD